MLMTGSLQLKKKQLNSLLTTSTIWPNKTELTILSLLMMRLFNKWLTAFGQNTNHPRPNPLSYLLLRRIPRSLLEPRKLPSLDNMTTIIQHQAITQLMPTQAMTTITHTATVTHTLAIMITTTTITTVTQNPTTETHLMMLLRPLKMLLKNLLKRQQTS